MTALEGIAGHSMGITANFAKPTATLRMHFTGAWGAFSIDTQKAAQSSLGRFLTLKFETLKFAAG